MHTPITRARAYQKMRDRRAKWFLENGPCKFCGSFEQLELHHIDPKTKEHHAVWSWKEVRMLQELSKCIVLCKKCHKVETANYISSIQTKPINHGTVHAYIIRGCRCMICVDNYKSKKRQRYLNRKRKEELSRDRIERSALILGGLRSVQLS